MADSWCLEPPPLFKDGQEDLCCPVCLEVFRDPVLLSCRHNFCKECLKRWWGERTIYGCPLCKRRSSEDNAPLNRFLGTVCQFFLRNKYQEKLKVCKEVQVKFAQTAEHIEVQARHTDRQFKKLHQFLAEEEEARLAALKEEKKQKSGMMKEKMEALSREIAALLDIVRATQEELRAAEERVQIKKKKNSPPMKEILIQQIKETDEQYALKQSSEIFKKRLELKTRLDLLTLYSAEHLLLHGKSKFYMYGDKPDKLLVSLLKVSGARQSTVKI
uniref:RING-type domain-containing protein n=1 Tax=Haplochromis burtoni TaxID=8153 RepID=A0A3Q2VK33_HAPBU